MVQNLKNRNRLQIINTIIQCKRLRIQINPDRDWN